MESSVTRVWNQRTNSLQSTDVNKKHRSPSDLQLWGRNTFPLILLQQTLCFVKTCVTRTINGYSSMKSCVSVCVESSVFTQRAVGVFGSRDFRNTVKNVRKRQVAAADQWVLVVVVASRLQAVSHLTGAAVGGQTTLETSDFALVTQLSRILNELFRFQYFYTTLKSKSHISSFGHDVTSSDSFI